MARATSRAVRRSSALKHVCQALGAPEFHPASVSIPGQSRSPLVWCRAVLQIGVPVALAEDHLPVSDDNDRCAGRNAFREITEERVDASLEGRGILTQRSDGKRRNERERSEVGEFAHGQVG